MFDYFQDVILPVLAAHLSSGGFGRGGEQIVAKLKNFGVALEEKWLGAQLLH